MDNQLLSPIAIAQESLLRLENNLTFWKQVNREYDDKFSIENEKVGFIYNARGRVRYRTRQGDGVKIQGTQEQMVPIAINRLWGCDLDFSDQDLTLVVSRFGERYVEPAVDAIVNDIDGEGLDLYKDVYNHAGTPGVANTDLTVYTKGAGVALANSACPRGRERALVVDADGEANALGFNNNIFNPPAEIGRQYTEGTMGRALGYKWSMDQNVARQLTGNLGTAGAPTSNPIVTVAGQTGSTLLTSGWDATLPILKQGDIISVAGMNGVNPISYRDTGKLRTFVITADVSSDGAGLASLPISPPISADTESPYQTVMNTAAASAVLRVYDKLKANFTPIGGVSSPQSLAFDKNAFCLAIVKQDLPGGMEWSERVTNKNVGLSVRLVRGYVIGTNRKITRLDVLGGWKTLQPQLACRVSG